MRRTLGEPLYAYLITLEDYATMAATKATLRGTEPCKILRDTELSIVFRWFAQLSNLKNGGASDSISPYHVQNSFVPAQQLPPEIELFANLSSKESVLGMTFSSPLIPWVFTIFPILKSPATI